MTRRTDVASRIWVVESYDQRAVQASIEVAPSDRDLDYERSLPAKPPISVAAEELSIGAERTWVPLRWRHTNCDGNIFKTEISTWQGESRRLRPNPPAPRQRTAVNVSSSIGRCTGTIVRDRWVLTGAHCVVTSGSNLATNIRVTNFVGETRTVASGDAFIAPGYNLFINGWDPSDDYAMLKYSGSFATATGDMDLSNAVDAVDDRLHNLGFPGWLGGCTANPTLVHTGNNEITARTNRFIRWRGDAGPGHSGGPVYYYPGAPSVTSCDSNDTGFVVGTVAGWDPVLRRFMGPRVRFFRSGPSLSWRTTDPVTSLHLSLRS